MKRRTVLKLMGAALPALHLPRTMFAQEKPAAAVAPPPNPQAFGYPMEIPPVPQPRMLPGEPMLTPAQAADVLSIQRLQMTYGHSTTWAPPMKWPSYFIPRPNSIAFISRARASRGGNKSGTGTHGGSRST